jgi:molybdopterin converting factor small subunit
MRMQISVQFFSYFKDLAGCDQVTEKISDGETLHGLYQKLIARFPKLAAMEKSTLMAVGVDYQPRDYVLKNGDEVSLFPPVQGG